MPPGLNSNGRTLPGRHGVAASPPGSQVFAHMCSLNNATLPMWVYCLLAWWRAVAGTRWRHRQDARWGSLLPLVRCLTDEGSGGRWRGRAVWQELSKNLIYAHLRIQYCFFHILWLSFNVVMEDRSLAGIKGQWLQWVTGQTKVQIRF